jgi:hypothetical protein
MSLWAEREASKYIEAGDKVKALVAKAFIASSQVYREVIGEIHLPTQHQEAALSPLSKETQQLIEQLKKKGKVVYDLSGKTPVALRGEGMKFSYVNPALENESSSPSLIAFDPNPDRFFLKGSQKLPHSQQLELLDRDKTVVEKEFPGAGLIVREGYAPEWVEAAFEHVKATGQKLFGPDHNHNWTWTNTYMNDQLGAYRAHVGDWRDDGLDVHFAYPDGVYPRLGLAPVVEIPRI